MGKVLYNTYTGGISEGLRRKSRATWTPPSFPTISSSHPPQQHTFAMDAHHRGSDNCKLAAEIPRCFPTRLRPCLMDQSTAPLLCTRHCTPWVCDSYGSNSNYLKICLPDRSFADKLLTSIHMQIVSTTGITNCLVFTVLYVHPEPRTSKNYYRSGSMKSTHQPQRDERNKDERKKKSLL